MGGGWHISYTSRSPWHGWKYDRFCVNPFFKQSFAEFLSCFFFSDNTWGNWCLAVANVKTKFAQTFFQIVAIFPELVMEFCAFHQHGDRFCGGSSIGWADS